MLVAQMGLDKGCIGPYHSLIDHTFYFLREGI